MVQAKIELITPELAAKYLDGNTNNRPLRKCVVAAYAADMKAGNWKLTHQGIGLASDGTLLDGQHRLAAIVESGIAVKMMVIQGIEKETVIAMDDHAKRSAGDSISILRNEKITADDVAIIRGAVEGPYFHSKKITKSILNELCDVFRSPMEFCKQNYVCNDRGAKSCLVIGQIAMAWFYVEDLDRLKLFCEILSGKKLAENPQDRAAHALREYLLKNGVQHGPKPRSETAKKVQSAIKSFMEYREVAKIYAIEPVYRFPLVEPVRTNSFDLLSV
jgi:hypothetical protein